MSPFCFNDLNIIFSNNGNFLKACVLKYFGSVMLDVSDGCFREHFHKSVLHPRTGAVGRLIKTVYISHFMLKRSQTEPQ